MSAAFEQKIHVALSDLALQSAIGTATARFAQKREDAVSAQTLPAYQELRDQAQLIKQHTLDNLDYYLELLETKVRRHSGEVLWCRDGEAAAGAVVSIAREHQVRLAVKAKSMVSEEIHLNKALEAAGIEPVETDLGEYIVQLAGERPYHIVAPALHKTRGDVARLFAATFGVETSDDPAQLTLLARRFLRGKFLSAGMGISGGEFLGRRKRCRRAG